MSFKLPLAVFLAIIILASIFYLSKTGFFLTEQNNAIESNVHHTATEHFEYLTKNRNSACYGIRTVMQMSDGDTIKGSCCGPMVMHTYEEQLEALKEYATIDKIPEDPYDIPVSSAKELINDFKAIQLTSEQQQTYEDAKKMSHEEGPCCCGDDFSETSCWRWKVYGGLAKYLITEYNFDAEQIAEVWDISDGCGGDHHVEGVH